MAETNEEDEKKEIKIFGCELCKISYNSEKDLKEHLWSLIHHAKIEDQKRNSAHTCSLCLSTCKTIPEYRKHLLDNRHKKAVEKFNIAEENGETYVYSGSEGEEEKGDNQINSVNRHQWWNPNNHPNYPPWNIPPWHRQNFKNFQQWGNVPGRRYNDMNNVRKPGAGRYMGDNSDQHPMNFNNWRGRNDRNFRREKFDGSRHKKGISKDEGFENPYWHNDDDWRSAYPPPLMMTLEDEQQWQNNEPYFHGYDQMPFQRNYNNFQGNMNPDMYNNYMNYEYNQDSPEFYDDGNYSERNDPPPPHDDQNKDFGRQPRSENRPSAGNQDNRPDEEPNDHRRRYDRPQSKDPNRRSDPRLNERRSSLEQDPRRDPNRRSDPRLHEKRSSIEQDHVGPKPLNIQSKRNKRQNEDEEQSPRMLAQKKLKTTIKGQNVSEQKKVTKTSASVKNSGKKNKPSPTKKKTENVNLRQGLRSRDKSKTPEAKKSKNNPPVASKRKARVAKSKAAFEITKSRDKIEAVRSSVIADTSVNMDSETLFEKEAEICSQVQELLEDNLSSESVSYQAPIPNILACNVKKRTVQTISERPTGGSFLSSIKYSEKKGKERAKVLLRSLLPDDIYSRPKKAKTFMKKKKSVKTSTVTSQSVLSEALVSSSSSITKSVVEPVEDRSVVQESPRPSESMPSSETLNNERQHSSEPSTTCDDTVSNRRQTITDVVPPKAVSLPIRSAGSDSHRSPRRNSTSRDNNPIILPNPSKVLKKPLTKEMLIKLVNSPRSRKERMQLASMLRNHAQSQSRLDSSRISHDDLDVSQVNQDLAGLCESLGGSQVPVVKIEDLTPEIQLQIAQLIETESELGSIEQSLIDVINEGSKENKQQQLPSNSGEQQIIVNTISSSAIVKAEPHDKSNKGETKEFSVQEIRVQCTPNADQSSRTRHPTQESTTSQNTNHSSPVIAPTTNVPSSIPSTDSTPQQNFMSNPYPFPGAYPFGYMPQGFNPYQQMSMQFPNQFHPQFNPAFTMFQMRNQNQTPPLGPENMGSSSSSNVDPTQSNKGPMPPMNPFCPFPNFNPMTPPNCPPFRMGNPSAVSSIAKSFTSQASSPIAFDEAKVPKIDPQTPQESSILTTVLQISMKEEDLQKELTELDTETGELCQVLQETFHKLKGCHDKKQKIEAKRVRLMERKMSVLKRCVGENVEGIQSSASRIPLTMDCSSEDDVTITATELCQDRISKIEPDTSVISPLPSLVHGDSSGGLLTNSEYLSPRAETLKNQSYSSQNSSIFLNSPQTDSQTSVMAESTDSLESLDEVIVESDCSTEDETTGIIKVMDKSSDDIAMSVDVIKQESSEQMGEMVVDDPPKESSHPRVSVSVSESIIINLDSSYESQPENIVKAETVVSSSSKNNSMLGSPAPCTTAIPNIEKGLFVSPNSENGFTVSPVKSVGYLRQRSASESDADSRQSDAKSPSLVGRSVKYLGAFTGSPDSASLLKQLAANFSGVTSISQLPLTKSNDASTNYHYELENSEVESERSLKTCSIVLEKLEPDQPEDDTGQVDSSVSSEMETNALSLSPVKDFHSKYHLDSSSDSTAEDSVPLANIKQRLKSQQSHVPNTPQFLSSSPVTALASTPLSKDSSTPILKHQKEASPLSKDSSTPTLKHQKEASPLSKDSSTSHLQHPKEASPLSKDSSTSHLQHQKDGYHPKSLEFESHENPQKPETTSVPGQQLQLQPDFIDSHQPSTSLVTSSQSPQSTPPPESNLYPLNVNLGAAHSEIFPASGSTVSPESNLSLYPLNVKLGAAHSEMFPVQFSDDDSESEDSDLLEIGSGYEAYLESFETSTNASNDQSISTKKSNKPFDGPRLTINGIHFDKDNVYVCYRGYGVRRFSKEVGELLVDYDTQDNTVNCMALATLPNGQSRLYLAGVAFYIMAYDVENSSLLYNIDVMEEVKCLHSDYGHVYGGLVNGMLEVISLQNNKKIDTYQSDDQCIHCITSAREGGFKLLCVSSQDATITIYDAFSGLPVRVLEGHSKTAFSVMVNMNKVYSGSGDKTVMVHDLHTGELEHVYREYKGMVTSVFIDRNYLYSASYDRLIRCYDVENQSLKCMYYGAGQRVVSSIVVHDRKLYTGNRDGEISVIPLDSKQVWPCQSDNCKHVFGIRDHLLYHLLNDHTVQNSFMTKCTWRGCKQWFYTQKDTKKFESHMEEHLEPVEF